MNTVFQTKTKEEWFREWLENQDFEKDLVMIRAEMERRKENPDWQRPVVMFGIRKKHTCIKKEEIAVICDGMPWQKRASMAETHWYHILYKRKATDKEWHDFKIHNTTRRYTVWSFFIHKSKGVCDIVPAIIRNEAECNGTKVANEILAAFEKYYNMKFQIKFNNI